MADERIEVDVVVNSDGAEKLNSITRGLNNLGNSASATGSKMSGGTNSLRNFVNTFSSVNTQLNRASRQLSWSLSGFDRVLRNGFRRASREIKTFVNESLEAYKELSEQHAKTTGAMFNNYDTSTTSGKQQFAQDADKLQKQAIQLAKGTNGGSDIRGSLYTPTDVSKAQTELVKAGVPTKDILDTNVLKTVMEFAQANELSTDNAVKFAVSLGSQFKYGYKDWGKMLDMVSHTADLSTIDVKDVVNSMKYAGGITSGLKRPIEEVLALVAEMGQFGLYGSQSGSAIQALYTRLLTQDTTVITDAQKEVAPKKALDAFYNFSKYAKSDGTNIKYDDVKNAKSYKQLKNLGNGNLKPMDEVVDQLDEAMSGLNDEEQAWFAKKFFGLYQMKGAYALISGDNSDMSIKDYENRIKKESDGINKNKLNQLLDSQYGKNQSFSSLIETTKTDVGQKLSPVVNAIRDELFRYIADEGNYDINFDNIRSALDDASDEIGKQYGKSIGEIVNKVGGMTIDLTEVGAELGPTILSGLNNVIGKILDGDIPGVFEEWNNMISDLGISIDNLPEDLQNLGDKVVGLIEVFGALTTLDICAKILDAVTSVIKIIQVMGGAVIKAGSVIVNGSNITGTGTGVGGGTSGRSGGNTVVNGTSDTSGTSKGGRIIGGIGNVAKFAGSLTAGYYGSQFGGYLGDNIEKYVTGEDDTSGVGGMIGGIAAGAGAYKLSSKAMSAIGGKLVSSWNSGALETARIYGMYGLDALKSGAGTVASALSGDALVGGVGGSSALSVAGSMILPVAALAGAGYIMYDTKKSADDRDKTMAEIARIHGDGDSILWDNNNKLMKNADGSLMTENQLKEANRVNAEAYDKIKEDGKYKFGYGKDKDGKSNEYTIGMAKPEEPSRWSSWSDFWNYDSNYSDYEKKLKKYNDTKKETEKFKKKDESNFNTMQEYLYNTTGILMSYDDYSSYTESGLGAKHKGSRLDVGKDINDGKFKGLDKYTGLKDEFKKKYTVGTDEWAKAYIDQVNDGIIQQGYTVSDDKGKRNFTIKNNKKNREALVSGVNTYEDKIDGPIQIMTNILNRELQKTDQYKQKKRNNGESGSELSKESVREIIKGISGKSDNKELVKGETEKNIKVVDKSNISIQPTTTPVTFNPNLNVSVDVDSSGAVKNMTPSQLHTLAEMVTNYTVNKSKSYNTDGKSK